MPHAPQRAAVSASAVQHPQAGGDSPRIVPRRVRAQDTGITEAASGRTGAWSHLLAGHSGFADDIGPATERHAQPGAQASSAVHLAAAINGRESGPALSRAAVNVHQAAGEELSALQPARAQTVRTWPLLVLALPAAVAVWAGWVGIGQMTGFGQVHPLPGIWDSLHLDTAVTLPVGVEAYAAYALRAWLSASAAVSARTRRFARASAIGSLLLGMAGQIAYHLLAQTGATHAPWGITTAVSCLPVLVLGMGAALAHLLRADSCRASQPDQAAVAHPGHPQGRTDDSHSSTHPSGTIQRELLEQAWEAGTRLSAAGQRVSRRSLRTAGVHGSNAQLGTVALMVASQLASQGQ